MSAMVMFTIVVFMVAVVNIYKVAKTKLKVQNIADAVALNIASQMAANVNKQTDSNEWLNNLYGTSNATSQALRQLPAGARCPEVDPERELPPISCAEHAGYTLSKRDRGKPFSFNSKDGAKGYGNLIKTINQSQRIFQRSYNAFIGATPGIGQRALGDVLKDNIPELRSDPTLKVIVWNNARYEDPAKNRKEELERSLRSRNSSSAPTIDPLMDEMKFKIHDMVIAYDENGAFGVRKYAASGPKSLGQLVSGNSAADASNAVGWMEVDTSPNGMPTMKIRNRAGQIMTRMGTGAYVIKRMDLAGIPLTVSARATAYLVPGTGKIPMSNTNTSGQAATERPEFKPTYWVKLGDR